MSDRQGKKGGLYKLACLMGILLLQAPPYSWGLTESVQPTSNPPQWTVVFWDYWSCPDCYNRAPKSTTPDAACRYWLDSPVSASNPTKNGDMYIYLGASILSAGSAQCNLKYRHIDITTIAWVYTFGPAVTCPDNTFTFNLATGMCEREIPCQPPNVVINGQCKAPEIFTIILDQKSADLQPARAAANDLTFRVFKATVTGDQNGVKANTPVTIRADVKQGTGGHDHTDALHRPKGYLYSDQATGSCDSEQPSACITGSTDANGDFVFAFIASQVSGKHTVTASCKVCEESQADLAIAVAVKPDLMPIPDSPLYALKDSTGDVIGAIAGKHEANHFLTSASIVNLKKLATEYQLNINPDQRLYLNDASLEFGGLLDVGSTPWQSPHHGHRRGFEIDIRAAAASNGGPVKEGAIPFDLFGEVWKRARALSINAELHCMENQQLVMGMSCYWLPEARHFHVNLK